MINKKARNGEMQKYDYFVAHEFSKQKMDYLREAIEEAFKGSGLKAYYADIEVRSQEHILEKSEERILTTQFGIYDVTNGNPNVCLELGIARGAKKPYYIIHEKGTKLPADLEGLGRIEYESYKQLTKETKEKVVKKEIKRFSDMKKLIQKSRQKYKNVSEEIVLKKCFRMYQAEELPSRFGYEVEDEDASNKRAWFADLSELRHHIIYGPYESLPEQGRYQAFFKIKIDDNTSIEPVLTLSVIHGGFASRTIYKNEFDKTNTYQLFELDFEYRSRDQMEYTVYNVAYRGKVWIDYVAIVKLALQNEEYGTTHRPRLSARYRTHLTRCMRFATFTQNAFRKIPLSFQNLFMCKLVRRLS